MSIQDSVRAIATCWKITCTNGKILCITTNHKDLYIDNYRYLSNVIVSSSTVRNAHTLAVNRLYVQGIVTPIIADAIENEEFKSALVEIVLVINGEYDSGKIPVKIARVNTIEVYDSVFVLNMLNMVGDIEQTIGSCYSCSCRALLGDNRCAVNLMAFSHDAMISAIISDSSFIASGIDNHIINYFTDGKVRFMSGNNVGIERSIVRHGNDGIIELLYGTPKPMLIGEACRLIAGCDKTFATCINKFNNAINFRGEPSQHHMQAKSTSSMTMPL